MTGSFLIQMSDNKNFSKLAVVGLGYVGLPLCIRFCESGLEVLGLDIDQEKVDSINAGRSYIQHIDSGIISDLTSKTLLTPQLTLVMFSNVTLYLFVSQLLWASTGSLTFRMSWKRANQ